MTNLFQVIANGSRGLNKTAELTTVAEKITSTVFNNIGNSLDKLEKEIAVLKAETESAADKDSADYAEKLSALESKKDILDKTYSAVEDSKVSHDAMDKLITAHYDLQVVDTEFLKFTDTVADDADEATKTAYEVKKAEHDATIDKMIKSQQSKRSRSKSKAMTQDNYTTLMVGAVAENLLRLVSGKEKSSVGHSSLAKPIEYDEAAIEIYKADKEKLNKEIRNIQSKKSIMKSKAGLDDQSEGWLKLLGAESMLKGLRGDAAASTVTKVIIPAYVKPLVEVKKLVDESTDGIDVAKMKGADAKELLAKIIEMMSDVEVPVDEEEQPNTDAE